MTYDELVEIAAQAMHDAPPMDRSGIGRPWGEQNEQVRERWRHLARAALGGLLPALVEVAYGCADGVTDYAMFVSAIEGLMPPKLPG